MIKKRFLSLLSVLALLVSAFSILPVPAAAEEVYTSGDFRYAVNDDGTVRITGYTGQATQLAIPATLEGKKVTRVENNAFKGQNGIQALTVPAEVQSIGDSAFENCTGLQQAILSAETIGANAFAGCTGLQQVMISAGVKTIGASAFASCSALQVFQIQENATLQAIGDWAFVACKALRAFTIPDSVTDLGVGCFLGCTSLETAVIGNGVTALRVSGYIRPDNGYGWGYYGAFQDCTSLKSVSMGKAITAIGGHTFQNTGLTSIDIHNQIQTIGEAAFENCDSLTEVRIGNGVTTVGANAFESCDALTKVDIGDNVTSIGERAFANCGNLESVSFGKSVETIGDLAFFNTGLTSVTIPNNVTNLGAACFLGCTSLETAVIGNGVTALRVSGYIKPDNGYGWGHYGAFQDCTSLKSVSIGSGVITIDQNAFKNTGLTSVTIPDNVVTIEEYAFAFTNLESAVIGDGVVTIGACAFWCDADLKTVSIGSGVTAIGDLAFFKTGLTAVTIPSNVTNLGAACFLGCTSLETAVIGNGVTGLRTAYDIRPNNGYNSWGDYGAFQDCTSLKSVSIGSGVIDIEESAFRNTALTSVTIPDKVATIGESSFSNIATLSSVYFAGNHPSDVNEAAFRDTSPNLKYYVISGKTGFDSSPYLTNDYTPVKITFVNTNTNVFAIVPMAQIASPAGARVIRPIDPIAAGYLFTGWYADEACTTPWNFDQVVTADTNIYLGWVKATDAKPVRPVGLKTDGQTGNSITVSWSAVEAADTYSIYVDGILKAENIQTTTYTITGLVSGTTYDIEIAGVNRNGEGVKSLALAAKTERVAALGYGDVDADGDIDIIDALMALQAAAQKIHLTDEQKEIANVDGQGDVSAADALLILKYATGQINFFLL